MSETNPQAPANLARDPRLTGALYENIADLMADERLNGLPSEERGKVIVDRFVGQLVANGGVKTSEGLRSPADVLVDFRSAVNTWEDKETWNKTIMTFTRTDGLRFAVSEFRKDSDTNKWLTQNQGDFLKVDEKGATTLTSLHQLEGYVYAATEQDEPWKKTILSEVQQYAQNKNMPGRWETGVRRELLSSDVPLVRQSQQSWERDAREAREAGIDMDVIARTANELRARVAIGGQIAHIAIENIAPEVNYDQLFRD